MNQRQIIIDTITHRPSTYPWKEKVVWKHSDIDNREMFQDAINAIDPKIDIILFESGRKVRDYITHAEFLPNYLFVDINMPKMNGYEFEEHIRQIPGNDHIQIVMYSTGL